MSRSDWPRAARLLSSRRVLTPLLVLALAIGGFVGYGAYTRAQPTRYARGGAAFGPAAGQLAPSDPTATAAVAASARPRARASAVPSPGTSGASVAGSVVGPAAAAPSMTPAAASGRRVIEAAALRPRAGTYALAVTGDEHVSFGPFAACHNDFPARASLTVSPAAGEPAGSYDFDLRLYPGTPNRHDERHIYRYSSAGVDQSYEEATVTCAGVKQSTTVDYTPVQPRVRLPLRVGATWTGRGGDRSRTEVTHSTVTRTEPVQVGGRSVLTYVIETSVTMSGSESGTRKQTWWWSPVLALPVKVTEVLSGHRSGASYQENVTYGVIGLP